MPFIAVVWCRTPDAARAAKVMMDNAPQDVTLVGLFRYPERKELQCRGFCVGKNHTTPWTRDKRGHMKCGVCGSRHRDARRRVIGSLFDNLGANLLKNPVAIFRTPEGYK